MQNRKFKQTEIGKIPEDWEEISFGDIATISRGASPRPIHDFISTSGIPWVKISDATAQNSRYIDWTNEFILEKGRKNTVIVKPGDLIVSNSATPGIPKFMKIDAAIHDGWLLIKPKEKVDKEFLYYVFISERSKLVGIADGTVFRNLKTGIVRNHRVLFPKNPLEQQSIASILSSLDSKIELNNQMNKTLEAIGQALFKRWFVDFEFPNEKGKPYKSSVGKMAESELGMIPEGWTIKSIKECGSIVCGKTPPTIDKENYGLDYPFITIPDMHNCTFIIKTERKLSNIGATTQKKKELPPLSICVSCIATPGLISLTTENSYTNQQINSITCNKNISPYFMYLVMKNKSEEIKQMGLGGTTTMNLNTGNFERIKIVVPEEKVMEQFEETIKKMFLDLLNNLKQNQALTQILDSLLPKLMSGEIRIK